MDLIKINNFDKINIYNKEIATTSLLCSVFTEGGRVFQARI
ncbi:MAG: hypothetical protein QME68_07650 [Elusimicrobiota bacterium]|nr:hypothetical protein [Elusimicrobiota bacterium]